MSVLVGNAAWHDALDVLQCPSMANASSDVKRPTRNCCISPARSRVLSESPRRGCPRHTAPTSAPFAGLSSLKSKKSSQRRNRLTGTAGVIMPAPFSSRYPDWSNRKLNWSIATRSGTAVCEYSSFFKCSATNITCGSTESVPSFSSQLKEWSPDDFVSGWARGA